MSNIHNLGLTNPFAKKSIKVGGTILNFPEAQVSENGPATRDTFKIIASATQTPQFSQYCDFNIDANVIDVLTDIAFVLNISALTTTSGTFKRFVNGAENFIQRFEIYAGDQLIENIYAESISTRNAMYKLTENKSRFYKLMGNDVSSNLVTKAAGVQEFFISIPSFYNTNTGWFLKSQSVPLRIRVYLANLADIVVTDGTSPVCTVNNVSLRVIGRDFENPGVVTALQQNNIKAGNTHFRYLIPIHQAKNTLVAGTTSYNINLSSLIGQFSHIFVIVRTAAQVSTALGNDFSSYVALSKFSIKNASGAILPSGIETDASFNILYQNNYNFTGDGCDINSGLAGTPKNIYSIVFSEKPELAHSQGVASGSVHLTGLGESLNLTFASALSANYIVDIIGFKYILLNLGANGTLKKVEI